MTTQPDLEAKQLELVEKWWVPCPQSSNHRYMLGMPEGGGEENSAICADCHGTGKVYPFRKPCLHGKALDGSCQSIDECRGYIPNVTLETMLEALWDAGWEIVLWERQIVVVRQVNGYLLADTREHRRGKGFGGAALIAAMLQIVREVSDAK